MFVLLAIAGLLVFWWGCYLAITDGFASGALIIVVGLAVGIFGVVGSGNGDGTCDADGRCQPTFGQSP
jgi:hypothetical protein